MRRTVVAVWVTCYLVCAMLTGAHYFNHRFEGYGWQGGQSVVAGAGWPLYWSGRVALAVTK